jgi:hypothetical protein
MCSGSFGAAEEVAGPIVSGLSRHEVQSPQEIIRRGLPDLDPVHKAVTVAADRGEQMSLAASAPAPRIRDRRKPEPGGSGASSSTARPFHLQWSRG